MLKVHVIKRIINKYTSWCVYKRWNYRQSTKRPVILGWALHHTLQKAPQNCQLRYIKKDKNKPEQ